jgi:hypothetical protein
MEYETLEKRFIEAMPDMRKQKMEWTVSDIVSYLELSHNPGIRDRLIKTLKFLNNDTDAFNFEKTHWHGTGFYLIFK